MSQQRVYKALTGAEILTLIKSGFERALIDMQLTEGNPPSVVASYLRDKFEARIDRLRLVHPRLASPALTFPFVSWECIVDVEWEPALAGVFMDISITLNPHRGEKVRDTLLREFEEIGFLPGGGRGGVHLQWAQANESAPDRLRVEAGIDVTVLDGPKQSTLPSPGVRPPASRVNSVELDYTDPDFVPPKVHTEPPKLDDLEVVAMEVEGVKEQPLVPKAERKGKGK